MDTVYLAYDCLPRESDLGIFTFPSTVDHHSNEAVLKHFEDTALQENIITFPNLSI